MGNEVNIEVNADNSTAKAVFAQTEALGAALGKKPVTIPVKAELAFDQANGPGALGKEIAKGPPVKVPVVADNPINEAFVAEVRSGIKSISNEALKIPLNPDLVGFETQLEEALTELRAVTKMDVPLDVGDAMEFRAQVAELVAQVEASTKAVIDVQIGNEGALTDLQAKTVAASQAELDLVAAQQKLNAALASGDEGKVAKARQDVVSASKEAAEATDELRAAQAATAETAVGVAEAEDVAAASSRGLMAAMGPLWMIMNVAQIAMFAFGSSSSSTAKQTQDVSQQIMNLGVSAGSTTQSLLSGNQSLQSMAGNLAMAGTSATAFAQAFSGSVGQARTYTDDLSQQMAQLGSTIAHTGGNLSALDGRPIADIAQIVKDSAVNQLPQGLRDQVEQYKALEQAVPQAKFALQAMIMEQQQEQDTLASLGFSLNAAQQANNDYGISVENASKAFLDATAGNRYLEDSTDKAAITAGQGIQQWRQLQQAVTSAALSYDQARTAVGQAEHGVEQAEQGVAAARHAEQQSVLAITTANNGYAESLYQRKLAQEAVTAADKAAEQQLISLKLQEADAATSALSARAGLEAAREAASKFGVNAGNAESVAEGPINPGDLAKVQAADALLQAENALADAQNQSKTSQDDLNTARRQGVANNPQVLAAEHALSQQQLAVKASAQQVADAHYAEQQAAVQVANAEYGVQQASQAVTQAENQERAASLALTQARDNASRSIDQNTLVGAENRQMIEQMYLAEVAAHGPTAQSIKDTEKFGHEMGFSKTQIDKVIQAVDGLKGNNARFSIIGTPSIDADMLKQASASLGLSLPTSLGAHAQLSGLAVGGAGNGLAWVGERGPEIVDLPVGSTVIPHANSMMMLASGQAPLPGFAAGGPVGSLASPMAALQANVPLAGQWGALDAYAQTLHAFGGPAVRLPPPGHVDLSSLGFGGGSHVSGDRARNKAIMQHVFAEFGWGSGPAWAAQDFVEMREAGYDNLAQNPFTSAFGMGQFVDATWATVGLQKTKDPYLQALGMARYEGQRYNGPIGAAAHERAVGWYGAGGPAGGRVGVGEHGPELAVIPGAGGGSGGAQEHRFVFEFGAGGESQIGSLFKYMIRTGLIRLRTVSGEQVIGS